MLMPCTPGGNPDTTTWIHTPTPPASALNVARPSTWALASLISATAAMGCASTRAGGMTLGAAIRSARTAQRARVMRSEEPLLHPRSLDLTDRPAGGVEGEAFIRHQSMD